MQASTVFCTSCGARNPAHAAFCFQCGKAMHHGTFSPTALSSASLSLPGSQQVDRTGRLPLGKTLNQRYKIVALLGQGGMGAVYKADDVSFGNRAVAVKEMRQSGMYPEEVTDAAKQFKQEALLLAGLKHPNLPSIYDHFSESGRWYLVMDFIEGETLQQYLDKKGTLPISEVLDIGIQLSKVLGYLHTRPTPIIFRDLKPLNIMLTPDGHIYLIDFGIARIFKQGQAKDTVAYFSTGYAAPEQYGSEQTTERSDIYSLGATLHQLLSGNHPKSNTTPFSFKPLQAYNPSISPMLAALIAQMVSTDSMQRPASMMAVRQALEQVQNQQRQPASPQYPPAAQSLHNSTPASSSYPIGPQARQSPGAASLSSTPIQVKPALPKHRVRNASLIGIVAGLLCAASMWVDRWTTNSGWLSLILVILICLMAGIYTGRVVVRRRMGFLTGCIAGSVGVIALFISFTLPYGIESLSAYDDLSYILIYMLIAVLICGLISLFGAWLATISHPYYKKPR